MQDGSRTDRGRQTKAIITAFPSERALDTYLTHTGMREFHAGCVKFTHARIKGGPWARDGLHPGVRYVFGDAVAFAMLPNDPKNSVVARTEKPIVRSVGSNNVEGSELCVQRNHTD